MSGNFTHLTRRLRALAGGASTEADLEHALARLTRQLEKKIQGDTARLEQALVEPLKQLLARTKALGERQEALEAAIRELGDQHAALRLAYAGGMATREETTGEPVPVAVRTDRAAAAGIDEDAPALDKIDSCPMCGCRERTVVCEFNRLILFEDVPQETLKRYDYSLCHDCGLVYAAQRPTGATFVGLMQRFDDNLGRTTNRPTPHAILNPLPLTDSDRETLRARASRGVFVSEHLRLPAASYLRGAQSDRLANSAHIELLGSLLKLSRPRVLELRPRLGSILAGLQRLYDAEVYALPLFESQQFLIKELYGIEASHRLDLDRFAIPYTGEFDLIIANHVLTHAVRPGELFATVRDRLRPGGHLYLYNECDDAEFLVDGKSMIEVLNPFHLQQADGPSLVRAFAAIGFETIHLGHHEGSFFCLLRKTAPEAQPMSEDGRSARLAAYARARDRSVLRLPESERARFAGEWTAVLERAMAAGVARLDDKGRIRLVKPSSK